MNETTITGRLRPMVRQCRSKTCPCPVGACQLRSALQEVEQEFGNLPPTLMSLRAEIEAKFAAVEAVCSADTDPDFFTNLQDHSRTRERRSEARYQLEASPATVMLATGRLTQAVLIDASFQGAGLLVPKSVANLVTIGDHVEITAPSLYQRAEIRGASDREHQTRLSVIWVEDLLH